MTKTNSIKLFNKFIVSGIIVSICFIAAGCNYLWNVLNRDALKKDIIELTLQCGVKISKPDCSMIDSSRQGYCKFTATEREITALVNGLKLNKVRAGLTADDLVRNMDIGNKHDNKIWGLEQTLKPFDIYKVKDRATIKAFLISGRPENLHLKSGRAFDYFLLYYDNVSSKACIFVCYSYG
ncbi:MAG: hypothetical protein PHP17_01920 [Candidatus Omnitrophica bacterium]|nr:hypothetical protein [Candidatus Omnitrophota bacterium]